MVIRPRNREKPMANFRRGQISSILLSFFSSFDEQILESLLRFPTKKPTNKPKIKGANAKHSGDETYALMILAKAIFAHDKYRDTHCPNSPSVSQPLQP
mmetsp:Transcript_31192/g.63418  ORF Transcript_31192/g.63418 Transcript_31192/m.63418 type:complete len:99 (-) Transcript_31192:241-537(-)